MEDLIVKCRKARRLTTEDFDDEIEDIIKAALQDLKRVGITQADYTDPLMQQAIITYFKANFGFYNDQDAFRTSYEQIRGDLSMSTGYTDWGEVDA